jgi:hypothetical protein
LKFSAISLFLFCVKKKPFQNVDESQPFFQLEKKITKKEEIKIKHMEMKRFHQAIWDIFN